MKAEAGDQAIMLIFVVLPNLTNLIIMSILYLLNKLGELLSLALFWIPAFAGMTATLLILS